MVNCSLFEMDSAAPQASLRLATMRGVCTSGVGTSSLRWALSAALKHTGASNPRRETRSREVGEQRRFRATRRTLDSFTGDG